MLMILYDTSSIKTFTDDKNTVNVEYFINKEHTYNKHMAKTTYIIIKVLIKQNVLFQIPNKQIDELTLTIDGVDIES